MKKALVKLFKENGNTRAKVYLPSVAFNERAGIINEETLRWSVERELVNKLVDSYIINNQDVIKKIVESLVKDLDVKTLVNEEMKRRLAGKLFG